ncbi:MAG: tetratricopeptide repeat protein [Chloracidobacterium sp.]|nr:tetratricopeptide repeat protein [Chloracidobacterium sp.]
MFRVRRRLSLFLSISAFLSTLPCPTNVKAQDLVATEDVAGGSSVFVFRESRKRPQARSAGGRAILGEGIGGGGAQGRSARSNAQIAAAAQKRRLAAIAARKRAVAIAAANRKVKLSNTLTTKAEGFLDNNQTDTAITNYRDALVQNPKNSRASEGLSNALTAKGIETAGETNNQSALVYFNEAVKFDKQNDVAYAKIGAIYDAIGQKDKATVNYEKALAINPEYTMLYPPLGLLYLDAGEIAKAETYLRKSDAAGLDTVETRFLQGVLHFKNNQNPDALAAFDRALELNSRSAEALYYRGQTLDRMGQPDQAIAAYKQTLVIAPTFGPASFDLGVNYYNKGDYQNAAVAYQNAVQIDPNNYQAHANLASTYRQMERFPEANAEYKLASVGIKNPDLYSEWGYCLGKTNEWDKSVVRLKEASDMSPSAVDNSNVGWAYYNSGNSQTAEKNDAAARADYELAKSYSQKATEQDPKLDAAYLNLGSTHNKLGEFQLAVSVLKTALGLRSNWVIATNQLGLGYRGMNDLVNAVATFKQVVNLDGNNTFGLFNLGESYYASGNKKEAKKINDKLKKLDPSLAATLDSVISGKVLIDATKQKIEQKVPKVPRVPF